MYDSKKYGRLILLSLNLIFAVSVVPRIAFAEDIKFDGTYVLAANGDVSVTFKLTPPMIIYQKLRDSVSNLYLVLREFASARADTEVADKKADWEDSNRTITFSMKLLGAGRNQANHWELDIPKGTEFINFDEGKRTFYFNESAQAGSMATIRGTSKLLMPSEAGQIKWEPSKRTISYVIPPVKSLPSHNTTLMILAGGFLAIGAVLTAVSFAVKA